MPNTTPAHSTLTIDRRTPRGRGWKLTIRLNLTPITLFTLMILSRCTDIPLPLP